MATLTLPLDPDVHAAETSAPAPAPAMVAAETDACPSCGTTVTAEFCGACGERRLRPEHFSMRHFARETWGELFDLDSRALRSVRLLFTQPGFLTLEALRGRRRPYVGALKMYLAVFAAVTLLSPVLTDQAGQRAEKANAFTAQFSRLVHAIAVHSGSSDAAAREAFTSAAVQHEGWLAILIPLLFAVFLFALFHRRRRWYGEHLLFAIHFATFNYGVGLILVLPQLPVLRPGKVVTLAIGLVTIVAMFAYMMVAVRRVYGGSRAAAAGWAVVLLIGFTVAQVVMGALSLATAAARLMYF
jgi:Protein of unknown function (DUF3667)